METNQTNSNQTAYYAAPPVLNEPPQKKGLLNGPFKIIIPIVLVFSIICIIAGIVLLVLNNNPKIKVMKAFAKTMTNVNTPISDYIGATNLQAMLSKGIYQQDLSLIIDDMILFGYDTEDYLTAAPGISLQSKMNREAKKASVDFSVLAGAAPVLDFSFYANDTKLAIACPDFFKDYLEFEAADIDTQFNESALSSFLDETMDTDLDLSLFGQYVSDQDLFLNQYNERYPNDLKKLTKTIQVHKIGANLEKIDGQSIKCTDYDMIIPAEPLIATITNMLTLYSETNISAKEDADRLLDILQNELVPPDAFVMSVSLDKKSGGIVSVSHSADYKYQNESYQVDLSFDWLGMKFPQEEFQVLFTILTEDDIQVLLELNSTSQTLSSSTTTELALKSRDTDTEEILYEADFNSAFNSKDNTFSFSSSMPVYGYDQVDIEIEGAFSQVTKGSGFTFDIDDFGFTAMNGDYEIHMSGAYSLKQLSDEIASPKGTALPLFLMTEEEIYALLYEIKENINASDIGRLY